jgi:4-amino-4-deoxy-L-arabinose transferase-like glycosyltransferase
LVDSFITIGMNICPTALCKSGWEKFRAWCAVHPFWTLTLLTLAALAPFLAKPFNIDDPLFVWAAQQVWGHPLTPYGLEVNWFGFSQPMWAVMANPPLMAYYLAGAAAIFGWNELGLHVACLLPAVAVVLGTYRLAQHFCRWPFFAGVVTLFAPGFLVSATTVMCDVLMLAFWIWAAIFWVEGLKQNAPRKLLLAGAFTALAVLTKYNGVCLIPLLAAYAWLEKRRVGQWGLFLLIPLAVLGIEEYLTYKFYGHPHFLTSNQYAQDHQVFHGLGKLIEVFTALTFTGGCFAVALFCGPFLWRKNVQLWFIAGSVLAVALAAKGGMMANYSWLKGGSGLSIELQLTLWSAGGLCVLALGLADVRGQRDAGSWLLTLWVLGTFIFAAFIYWMVNGRVILPMAPAVAILVARKLEQNRQALPLRINASIAACVALSLAAAQADFQTAVKARESAEQVCVKYATSSGRVWFEGHWGFQYYMQAHGAWPLDINRRELQSGDILIIPFRNSNSSVPEDKKATQLEVFTVADFPWIATMCPQVCAGFYSQFFGPLPFAFGPVPPQVVVSYSLKGPEREAN